MPFDREGTLRKAEKLLRQGKLDQAIAEYRAVIEDQPSDWNTANTLGDLYVRAGQIVSITVPVPNGTLNINAQPWAAVWIDGKSMGETPIGNLSIVPGQHEVLFRHPEFGERRERALVRSGAETRVAVSFQK